MSNAYLVWSHEHGAWWAGVSGYTTHLNQAGRFTRREAIKICVTARGGWRPGEAPNEHPVRLEDAHEVEQLAIRP